MSEKKIIDGCQDQKIRAINGKISKTLLLTIFINSGGWLYITFPFFLLISIGILLTHTAKSFKRGISQELDKLIYA